MTRSKSTRDVSQASHAAANSSGLPACVPVDTSSATRQRLLEAAEVLFYKEGFHAVGLDRLLAVVEISKQGFYRHFDSKEDLVVEVIRWHDRWWREQCRRHIVAKRRLREPFHAAGRRPGPVPAANDEQPLRPAAAGVITPERLAAKRTASPAAERLIASRNDRTPQAAPVGVPLYFVYLVPEERAWLRPPHAHEGTGAPGMSNRS